MSIVFYRFLQKGRGTNPCATAIDFLKVTITGIPVRPQKTILIACNDNVPDKSSLLDKSTVSTYN
jgi:hypothetical protein